LVHFLKEVFCIKIKKTLNRIKFGPNLICTELEILAFSETMYICYLFIISSAMTNKHVMLTIQFKNRTNIG
jgi:hypothetical protein